MRPLRWPRLWLGLWGAAIFAVVALSLATPPQSALEFPQGSDKLLHFTAYFSLSFSAIQLFSSARGQMLAALGLIALGGVLEWAQGALVPEARSAALLDGAANAAGVLMGMACRATRAAIWLQRLEARLEPLRP